MNKLELLDEKSRQAELGGGIARIEKQKAGELPASGNLQDWRAP